MTTQLVIETRNMLKAELDIPVKVTCDNNFIFDESTEFVVWDDENEMVYGIRPNTYTEQGTGSAVDLPIRVFCTSYEHIQYMEVAVDKKRLEPIIEKLKAKGLVKDENLKVIDKYFKQIDTSDCNNFI